MAILTVFNLLIGVTISGLVVAATPPKGQDRLACATTSASSEGEFGCVLENETSIRFFLVGDTGGWPTYPYYTKAQNRAAKQMRQMADERATHFQFSLGDNFYYFGVGDVDSKRFRRTFEEIYEGESLTTPWYVVAGNHDHLGDAFAQVLYTNRSSRWTMPHLYYSVGYRLPNGVSVEAVMIDTVTLSDEPLDYHNLLRHVPGRTGPIFLEARRQIAPSQWQWIEQRLQQSTADYLFVMGHFPVYSVSDHGSSQLLINRLKPLLVKYGVTAYISGHDHCLQYIQEDPDSVAYVVSGAGSRSDHTEKNKDTVPEGALKLLYPAPRNRPLLNGLAELGLAESGFVYTHINGGDNWGSFEFYDEDAKLIKKFDFKARRAIFKSGRPLRPVV